MLSMSQLARRWGVKRVLCPKHHETTPSCLVYPDGRAHCLGCGWIGMYEPPTNSPDGVSAVVTDETKDKGQP